jgi:adenylosuccinate synthase
MSKIVLGTGFGDEGKGATVSFLVSQSVRPLVIRFNGGHQAGHTVVHGDVRHVHSNFGSGTLHGVPTYWSKHCTIHPKGILNEYKALKEKGVIPRLFIDPLCPVTLPLDIKYNQTMEGLNNHGSVGVGFGATIERHEENRRIYAMDLLDPYILLYKLKLLGVSMFDDDTLDFKSECARLQKIVSIGRPVFGNCDIIFEGAQGILLDQEFGFFPHVTRSYCTAKNALQVIDEFKLTPPEMFYVTRTYATRHGNGPMHNEEVIKLRNNEQETNVKQTWQGAFRTGNLSMDWLQYAINCNRLVAPGMRGTLVVTCVDQRNPIFPVYVKNRKQSMRANDFVNFMESDVPSIILRSEP